MCTVIFSAYWDERKWDIIPSRVSLLKFYDLPAEKGKGKVHYSRCNSLIMSLSQ